MPPVHLLAYANSLFFGWEALARPPEPIYLRGLVLGFMGLSAAALAAAGAVASASATAFLASDDRANDEEHNHCNDCNHNQIANGHGNHPF